MSLDDRENGNGRRRFGEVLLAAQVVTEAELAQALRAQRDSPRRVRLGQALIELNLCSEKDIAEALSRQLGVPIIDLEHQAPPRQDVVDLVPRHLADRHGMLPLTFDPIDGVLTVAVIDPTNVVASDDLRTLPGVRAVVTMVAVSSAVERAQLRAYERGVASAAMAELGSSLFADDDDDPLADLEGNMDASDEPVIRLVNALLTDATRTRASDVHVEPERAGMRVRFRIDGMLREVQQIPRQLGPAVTSRLKIMSNLDIAERRRPQDGRAAIRVDGQEVDLRVSTMPSLYGETTVLRLLRKGTERLDIKDLGFDPQQRMLYEQAIGRSQGLIIMTGPTGSGKTTTLYAGLSTVASPESNAVTLEDPVEYQLDGVNQTQVQPKIGMSFAAGLRSVLRQDPDIIMVGEIRDEETATLAVEAAFTGHLVLSTLHTNDAPSTVARLAELGVERFLLGTTLTLVVAQRLARRVCEDCAAPYVPTPATLTQLSLSPSDLVGSQLMRGTGCIACDQTGYRGRVGLYEFLSMSRRLRQLVSDGGNELQIGALARAEGMTSLRQDGLGKARLGLVTLEEILRVTPEDQFRTEVDDAGDASSARERATQTAVQVGAIKASRLLVIGDAFLVDEALRALPEGWKLTTCGDTDDGLERIRSEEPDVVLLQGELHGELTIPALRTLREVDHDQRPVLLRTVAPLSLATMADATVLGITDHVDGEVDLDALRARLEAAVAGR